MTLAALTIWHVDLDACGGRFERHLTWLDARERQRCARFRFDLDRRRYVAAHAALRHVLAHRLGRDPSALVIEVDARGRPVCRGGPGFSLSHSGATGLLAIGSEQDGLSLGVDVERLANRSMLADAASWLSPAEHRAETSRPVDSLRRWVCKEAVVKALGQGWYVAPEDVAVAWPPPRSQGRAVARCQGHVSLWHLTELPVDGATLGVIATRRALSFAERQVHRLAGF